jgi:HEAT repeats
LPDLPPVEPPSAGFVVQLFVIPALVVVVVILVWLLFGKLAGGERDPMEYVRQLRSPTANWRLAYELASLIQNDPNIGSDPTVLGELVDLLSYDLDHGKDPELTQYLALTVGAFRTLDARTEKGQAVDPLAVLSRALEAKNDLKVRMAAVASLAKQAARMNGQLDDPTAVAALGAAAAGDDPDLRQLAVYALGFCGGPTAAKLLQERVQSDDDRFVRYNAAVALARRGDATALATLREMLSTPDLDKVITQAGTSGKQNKIESIQLEALEALRASTSATSGDLARSLLPEVKSLTHSGLVGVRTQAQGLLQFLQSEAKQDGKP